MDLMRKGCNRDSGYMFAFKNTAPQFSVDTSTGNIQLEVTGADGLGAQGKYEYRAVLDATDICAFLEFFGQQRFILEEGILNAQLRTQSHSLLRLLIASSGLPLALQPSEMAVRLAKLRAEKRANSNDD